jgi:hypothetical protein
MIPFTVDPLVPALFGGEWQTRPLSSEGVGPLWADTEHYGP